MSFLSNIIHFFVVYRFFLLFGFIIGGIVFLSLFKDSKWSIVGAFFSVIFFLAGIVNLIWGTDLNNAFLNKNGKPAEAVITKEEITNSTYNDVPIERYHLLMLIEANKTIQTTFESTAFNIYPTPENGYNYPNQGERFMVKYIPGSEDNFIILTNKNSPYGQRLACDTYFKEIEDSKTAYEFNPSNATFKNKYTAILHKYVSNKCSLAEQYQKEWEILQRK